MSNINPVILAEGRLPNADGELYSPAAGFQAGVRLIVLHNDSGGTVAGVNVYPRKAASANSPPVIAQSMGDGHTVESPANGGSLSLDDTDALRGSDGGNGGAAVWYTIHGYEEAA